MTSELSESADSERPEDARVEAVAPENAAPVDPPLPEGSAAATVSEPPVKSTGAPTSPVSDSDPLHQRAVRRLTVLGVAAVLLVAGAVLLAFANHAARSNGPLSNHAFVDTGSTSAVVSDVTAAIKVVYSYDYQTLDANQAAAKAVITGNFAQDFDKVFAGVRQLAPQQRAVLTTTVPAVGVVELQNEHAQLLMMVDQNGTRLGSQPIAGTSARLIVEAQQVDGHWKISEVTPE